MTMLINANAQRIPLCDNSVHCVVTSPPYFGLRSYQAGAGEMGCEATPEAFVANLVIAFREVWRVLREDGVAVLNLGDCFGGSNMMGGDGSASTLSGTSHAQIKGIGVHFKSKSKRYQLKSKNLIGIPWRAAFALQADGWYLRHAIPWIKANPMPESVKDRPATAHEYIFLLSKRKKYFYDAEEVKREVQSSSMARRRRGTSNEHKNISGAPGQHPQTLHRPCDNDKTRKVNTKRNFRTSDFFNDSLDLLIAQQRAWLAHLEHIRDNGGLLMNADGDPRALKLATFPYKGAHFATFPPKLVVPFIKAGTSERGVCGECGAAFVRVVEKELVSRRRGVSKKKAFINNVSASSVFRTDMINQSTTLGYSPTCACDAAPLKPGAVLPIKVDALTDELDMALADFARLPTVPATVLDPFCGSGTTLLVSRQLGRRGVGLDLSYSYLRDQARVRLGLDCWAAWLGGQPAVEDDMVGLPMFEVIK